ncbi:potassium voltage-gated channel subfamily A member 7-like isoform X2 [Branchiostoma lanceolatum]|uniref:potassium voltage-gated channel subfamily A member 7-like isoform X2 n=1 Tax=Branchiostoma lanceolatum TaxID=7740 RepID=UPI0034533FCC
MEGPRRPHDFEDEDTRVDEQNDSVDDTALLLSKTTLDEYETVGRKDRHIRLNVSGMMFETWESTLHRYPNTLLGDHARRQRFYCPDTDEYFFDRHRPSFEAIFRFYQRGQKRSQHGDTEKNNRLVRPKNVPVEIFYLEMKFFGLESAVIKECLEKDNYTEPDVTDVELPTGKLKRKIWLLFDFPESSPAAKFVGIISIVFIIISIAVFCAETLPEFAESAPEFPPNGTITSHLRLLYSQPLFQAETACIIWFCFELIIRFYACPNKCTFWKDPLNIFDFLAIAPYFVDVVMVVANYHPSKTSGAVTVVRLLRLFRIVRIFKLSRHVKGLRVLGKSMIDSIGPFFLLVFLIMIAMTLFGSCVYFAEMEHPETNWESIPDTFWYVIITMTTVGYGDHFPVTAAGKLVGGICVISGILTLALPSPAIVANFDKNNKMSKNIISEEILERRLRSDKKRNTPGSLIKRLRVSVVGKNKFYYRVRRLEEQDENDVV